MSGGGGKASTIAWRCWWHRPQGLNLHWAEPNLTVGVAALPRSLPVGQPSPHPYLKGWLPPPHPYQSACCHILNLT